MFKTMQILKPQAANIQQSEIKLFYTLHSLYLLGIVLMIFFLPLHYWFDATKIIWANGISIAVFLLCIRLNVDGRHITSISIGAILTIIHSIITSNFYGWNAGFFLYSYLLAAGLFLLHKSPLYYRIIGFIIIALSLLFNHYTSPLIGVSFEEHPELMSIVLDLNLITVLISISFISFYYATSSSNSESSLLELSNKLKIFSETDQLSQLTNRRGMQNILNNLNDRQDSQNTSIAILDIDYFKQVNDNYGHATGDEVIREVASVIKNNLRTGDFASRWGGEEFLLCIHNCTSSDAYNAMEKIRIAISSIDFKFNTDTVNISVTIGVGYFDGKLPMDKCIEQADRALYFGKNSGRNKVVNFDVLE